MKRPSQSKLDLPRELWQEILSRLSVKPILRFRCVSKSWRSMIDDPAICHLHLHCVSNNRKQTHLLVLKKDLGPDEALPFKSITTFKLLTESAFNESYFTLPTPHDRKNWNPLSSIDGLVILVEDEKSALHPSSTPNLLLWNPSIRKSRILPLSPTLPPETRYVDMGFGFDPLINDYKHVRIAYLDDDSPQFVAIYTFSLDSWKTVPFQSKGCSSCRWISIRVCTPCRSRGRLFSIAFNQDSRCDELVSFDLSNEVFNSKSLPEADMMFSFKKNLTVVNDEFLLVQHLSSGAIVWTLESSETDFDSMYWTERYSINIINGTFTLLPSTLRGHRMKETLQNKPQVHLIRMIIDSSFSIAHSFDYFESLLLLK